MVFSSKLVIKTPPKPPLVTEEELTKLIDGLNKNCVISKDSQNTNSESQQQEVYKNNKKKKKCADKRLKHRVILC